MTTLQHIRARHRENVVANLERRVYEGVTRKLSFAQILDVAMSRHTYELTAREIRVVRHQFGLR